MLLTYHRKKVLTEPRLSKSKSPSSSGNRWYTGGDDEAETTPSMWHGGYGHLLHATTNELSPPLIGHDDASSVSFLKMLVALTVALKFVKEKVILKNSSQVLDSL